jgi:hypothetical protein
MLLIIATEAEEHGTGQGQAAEYLPLHSMTIKEWPAEVKDGKEVRPTRKSFASLLNGKAYNKAFEFVNIVKPKAII